MTPKTKVCTKCGKRKKLEEFYRQKRLRVRTFDYVISAVTQCKQCVAIKARAHYLATRDQFRDRTNARQRQRYREHPETYQAYRDAHKEETKAYNKAYKAKDPEATRVYTRAERKRNATTYKANYERHKQDPVWLKTKSDRDKTYREANKARLHKQSAVYRERVRPLIRIKARNKTETMTDEYLKQLLCSSGRGPALLSHADIPQALVDAKREHLKNVRLIRAQA